jgi:hypothetical protein
MLTIHVQASSDGFNLIDIPGTVYGITICGFSGLPGLPDLAEAMEFKGLTKFGFIQQRFWK